MLWIKRKAFKSASVLYKTKPTLIMSSQIVHSNPDFDSAVCLQKKKKNLIFSWQMTRLVQKSKALA